jgi:tRNA(fMet)-specific endonuclease VapC
MSADDLGISVVSAGELYHRAAKSAQPQPEMRKVQELLTLLRPIDFGSEAALAYGLVRSFLERNGQVIGPLDMLIAAHALSADATLVTHNTLEFGRLPGLRVEDWTA